MGHFWPKERRNVRRSDETCVKQRRSDGDSDRASRRPKTRKPAAGRRCRDPRDDQRVPEWAPAEAPDGHDDDRERADDVRDDREQAGWQEGEVILRGRDSVGREGTVNRYGDRDADGEARIDEDDGRGAPAADQEK
jgi:hypothetical protein